MKLNQIESSTKINPLGKEIKYGFNNQQQRGAILLIHGFGGKSSNWDYIAKEINNKLNLAVYVPRLPGHATNTTDFLNSSADQWLRKIIDSYLFLKNDYQDIYLAGLSMGGLLATLLASNFKVKKLSLIAPAFFAFKRSIAFTPYLKYFIKKVNNDFKIDENNLTEAEIDYHNNYSFNYYPEALAELYKLMKKGRKAAAEITAPTQLILSTSDQQVDSKQIEKFLNKKMGQFLVDQKIYQKSSHVIINDLEKERCAEDIINFFSK
ncbi:esterase/lipase [Halanaerobium saccharolyticum]|uniref:Esterase/lipase n=1 Tax=Halanaerobium saccharolyticum TaxID=43595 RepID=A0A4R7Z6K4_9FIRM|nr:alpha/beta fold hydrolase [Halanaerobium saccharolyticum]RAK11150.1 esterase/lipase [Halanaerobium saccharolyticum]TDW07001.1 esterase/lipase [Halanaerobium saccharolyticum]TDX63766.1 esterase/lipase [Halanaerobium saccharolyticum]